MGGVDRGPGRGRALRQTEGFISKGQDPTTPSVFLKVRFPCHCVENRSEAGRREAGDQG